MFAFSWRMSFTLRWALIPFALWRWTHSSNKDVSSNCRYEHFKRKETAAFEIARSLREKQQGRRHGTRLKRKKSSSTNSSSLLQYLHTAERQAHTREGLRQSKECLCQKWISCKSVGVLGVLPFSILEDGVSVTLKWSTSSISSWHDCRYSCVRRENRKKRLVICFRRVFKSKEVFCF